MNPTSRSGAVAVIGRPNVGKSTLVNALVGAKVSITSNRPQTTRHRLLGIATFPGGQLLLVDTPGIHGEQGKRSGKAMNRMMNRAARGALEGVDAALLVIEAGRWDDEDALAYDALREAGLPVVLVVNQVDKHQGQDRAAAVPRQGHAKGANSPPCIRCPRSSATGLEPLVATLLGLMPERAGAVRRGRDHRQEPALPRRRTGARAADAPAGRGAAVRHHGGDRAVRGRTVAKAGVMYRIDAVIWVEREGQKAIVIGKGGERLREIGKHARASRWSACSTPRCSWRPGCACARAGRDDEAALRALGYHD